MSFSQNKNGTSSRNVADAVKSTASPATQPKLMRRSQEEDSEQSRSSYQRNVVKCFRTVD